ncbi:response regulator transcription factor [filamentous cyanobacterium LEGE 11480]|uniref:Response regulator transcription factor n=1 Tax=Romeriopsis navalis LEGE 11480 TaxID=2777977 RepID=A0A928VPU7_9CYAN|nr:response regulator transcription factor [Romeriopsis navalis]MBE9029924.1 response regulator transcription factor [Romeriopsis navalis LEGE 11480]
MADFIRVFIVDDQALIRDGLRSLLLAQPDIEVVGDATNGAETITKLAEMSVEALPAVLLLDIRMPVMDGIATTREIRSRFPDVSVLILTTFDDDQDVSQAMRAGAQGYLLKDTPSEDLANAIRSIHQGYTYLGPGLIEKALGQPSSQIPTHQFPELTPREREILQLIGTGANNREIAAALYISDRTVKNHVTNILSRLGLRDRTQAALYVQKHRRDA